jgi:hypothetical protein
MRVGA